VRKLPHAGAGASISTAITQISIDPQVMVDFYFQLTVT
jgi:hypothetical protein